MKDPFIRLDEAVYERKRCRQSSLRDEAFLQAVQAATNTKGHSSMLANELGDQK